MPLVSILIPAYNQEKIISKAIESAIAQDYKNKEILVCDDCSTDETWQVIKKFKKIKIFKNLRNLGRVGNHRHLYQNLAKGKYAIMLDGDDYFCDTKFVTKAVEKAEKNKLKLVFAQVKMANKSNNINYLDIFKKGVLFMHGAVMTDLALGNKVGFYNKNILADDQESFLRLIVKNRIGFIKRSVYVYKKNNDADRYSLKMRLENDTMIESVYKYGLKTDPENVKVYETWRKNMLATFFVGNVINLSYHLKFVVLIKYLNSYGLTNIMKILKQIPTGYTWGYGH